MNRIVSKLFDEKEVMSTEKFYEFIDRKKFVVFVPHKFLDKVTGGMSKAGAGLIGNYEMCSFRTEGTGTFKPNKKAKPVLGKRNFLSNVEEVKLEMECDPENVNEVTDELLKNHPYEEAAYEIYDFKKRGKKEIGLIVNLKSKMTLPVLFTRMNKNISKEEVNSKIVFKRIAIINSAVNENITDSAKFINCEYLISMSNKNYKLFRL